MFMNSVAIHGIHHFFDLRACCLLRTSLCYMCFRYTVSLFTGSLALSYILTLALKLLILSFHSQDHASF